MTRSWSTPCNTAAFIRVLPYSGWPDSSARCTTPHDESTSFPRRQEPRIRSFQVCPSAPLWPSHLCDPAGVPECACRSTRVSGAVRGARAERAACSCNIQQHLATFTPAAQLVDGGGRPTTQRCHRPAYAAMGRWRKGHVSVERESERATHSALLRRGAGRRPGPQRRRTRC